MSLEGLDMTQTIEGPGVIEHEDPIPTAIRVKVLRDVLVKWQADHKKEYDHDWREHLETAMNYLEDEIDFLESQKR